LRGPEALVEVDLRDVLSHKRANREPGKVVHDAGEDEERRKVAEPLQHPARDEQHEDADAHAAEPDDRADGAAEKASDATVNMSADHA